MKRSPPGSPPRSPKRAKHIGPCMFCGNNVAEEDAYIHCKNNADHKECVRRWIQQGTGRSNECQHCFNKYTPAELRELVPSAQSQNRLLRPIAQARIPFTFPEDHPLRIETINTLSLALRTIFESGRPFTVADLENLVLPYDNHPDFVYLNDRDKAYIKDEDARRIVIIGFYEQRKNYLNANLANTQCVLAVRNRLSNLELSDENMVSPPVNIPLQRCELTKKLVEIFKNHSLDKLNNRHREVYSAKCGSFETTTYSFSEKTPITMRLAYEEKVMIDLLKGHANAQPIVEYLSSPYFEIEALIRVGTLSLIESPPAGISMEIIGGDTDSSCAIMGGKTRNKRRNKRRKTNRNRRR